MKRFDRGPDFLGIGVQRAGTSWLFSCLVEHPNVFMPRKEFHFFDKHYDKGVDWYAYQFNTPDENVLRGEYTPDYISSPEAMERIHTYNPEIKLLVLLRNPLDRAYSAYRLFQAHGHFEGMSLDEAIRRQPSIMSKSLYSEQLELVLRFFPRENVFIGLFDDIGEQPAQLFRDVCGFLGVDVAHTPAELMSIKNSSGLAEIQAQYRLPQLQAALSKSWARPIITALKRTPMYESAKRRLLDSASKSIKMYEVDEHMLAVLHAEVVRLDDIAGVKCERWLDGQGR